MKKINTITPHLRGETGGLNQEYYLFFSFQ